jgi:hypothetical protein
MYNIIYFLLIFKSTELKLSFILIYEWFISNYLISWYLIFIIGIKINYYFPIMICYKWLTSTEVFGIFILFFYFSFVTTTLQQIIKFYLVNIVFCKINFFLKNNNYEQWN